MISGVAGRQCPRRGNSDRSGSGGSVDGSCVGNGSTVGKVGIVGASVGTGFGTVGSPGSGDDVAVPGEADPVC
jgi:hypothetical protein